MQLFCSTNLVNKYIPPTVCPCCDLNIVLFFFCSKRAFLRFETKCEAVYTLKKKHGTEYMGIKFEVTPAKEKRKSSSSVRPTPQNKPGTLAAPQINDGLLATPQTNAGLLGIPQTNAGLTSQSMTTNGSGGQLNNSLKPISVDCGSGNFVGQPGNSHHLSTRSPVNGEINSEKRQDNQRSMGNDLAAMTLVSNIFVFLSETYLCLSSLLRKQQGFKNCKQV